MRKYLNIIQNINPFFSLSLSLFSLSMIMTYINWLIVKLFIFLQFVYLRWSNITSSLDLQSYRMLETISVLTNRAMCTRGSSVFGLMDLWSFRPTRNLSQENNEHVSNVFSRPVPCIHPSSICFRRLRLFLIEYRAFLSTCVSCVATFKRVSNRRWHPWFFKFEPQNRSNCRYFNLQDEGLREGYTRTRWRIVESFVRSAFFVGPLLRSSARKQRIRRCLRRSGATARWMTRY